MRLLKWRGLQEIVQTIQLNSRFWRIVKANHQPRGYYWILRKSQSKPSKPLWIKWFGIGVSKKYKVPVLMVVPRWGNHRVEQHQLWSMPEVLLSDFQSKISLAFRKLVMGVTKVVHSPVFRDGGRPRWMFRTGSSVSCVPQTFYVQATWPSSFVPWRKNRPEADFFQQREFRQTHRMWSMGLISQWGNGATLAYA